MSQRHYEPYNVGNDRHSHAYECKIVVTGDSGVGKTSLIRYYTKGIFPNNLASTVGVEFAEKYVQVSNVVLQLKIWDTAGQERFKSLVKSYYRNAMAVLLVYDVTNRKSFDNCDSWLKGLTEQAEIGIVVVLVGNKTDLIVEDDKKREVSVSEALTYARNNHLFFVETSAKRGSNVNDVFVTVANELVITHLLTSNERARTTTSSATTSNTTASTTTHTLSNVYEQEYVRKMRYDRKETAAIIAHDDDNVDDDCSTC